MNKEQPADTGKDSKKGYNEKNPAQPQGAFPPASDKQQPAEKAKSNSADKKEKEDAE